MTKIINTVRNAINNRRRVNATIRELRRLTDRDLADLGMSRADIVDIARASVDS